MEEPSITYEKIQSIHVHKIVQAHKSSFINSFSTLMGDKFLKKMYSYPLINKKTFGYVALFDNKVVGVVLGTEDSNNHRKNFFSDNFFVCMKSTIFAFMKKPSLILVSLKKKNLLNDVKKSIFKKESDIKVEKVVQVKKSTLLSICVIKEFRGSNIATELVNIFRDESSNRNCQFATLSVQADNKRAVNFYEKLGWSPTWEGVNSEGKISKGYEYSLMPRD